MRKKRKRFNSEKSAQQFAKKVNGQINDLRKIENAKSSFTVTYEVTEKTRSNYYTSFLNTDDIYQEYFK